MRFIIRQFAEEVEDGRGKILFYVDPSDEETKRSRLESVFPQRSGRYPTVVPFNGTFNDFVRQYLQAQKRLSGEEHGGGGSRRE
jgi:hypothetical protein